MAFEPVQRLWAKMQARAKDLPGVTCYQGSYEDLGEPESVLARCIDSAGPYDAVILGWESLSHLPYSRVRSRLLRGLRSYCPAGPVLISFWSSEGRADLGQGRVRRAGFSFGTWLGGRRGGQRWLDSGDQCAMWYGYGHLFSQEELCKLVAETDNIISSNHISSGPFPHITLSPRI